MHVDLRYAAKLNLLWVGLAHLFDEASWLTAVRAVEYFIATRGACSGILDLSTIETFDISAALARDIAAMKASFPAGWLRGVVMPSPTASGVAHLIQALRSASKGPLLLCRDGDEALRRLGVAAARFDTIDLPDRGDSAV